MKKVGNFLYHYPKYRPQLLNAAFVDSLERFLQNTPTAAPWMNIGNHPQIEDRIKSHSQLAK